MPNNNNNNNRNNNNNNNKPSGGNGGNAKPLNQVIQNKISDAGRTVDYKEASAVAQKLGVSVDRVYNQTAKTGQTARAGAAAANAGYLPSSNLKVDNPIVSTYVQQAAFNAQSQVDQAAAAAAANNGAASTPVPEFDWQSWNAQMMAQQAAIWESMDAMNAEFMRKQEEWMAQRQGQEGMPSRNNLVNNALPSDKATVKRKKRVKSAASTGLNTPSTSGNTLSLGGGDGPAGGLSIGRG
jgi:hypothetical protein